LIEVELKDITEFVQ